MAGDSADKCFKSTKIIAGVKDTRFQTLRPGVLHWLGIKKVDKMISMSDMKYDVIIKSGVSTLYHLVYHIFESFVIRPSHLKTRRKLNIEFTCPKRL